jgi:TatD DNase family protein
MIDTHCHLTFKPLLDQIEAVLERARQAGVDRMISVGTSPDDSHQAATLTDRFDHVYTTVGIHPHYADPTADLSELAADFRKLAGHPKVVALGEMGLDNHYPDPPIEAQRRVFAWQLELAKQMDGGHTNGHGRAGGAVQATRAPLPIIIHNREATDEVLGMIRDSGIPGGRFVFHCFTGTAPELDAILDLGSMVSFTGVVTFKNATDLAACAARVPLDRLMIETDSPYLTPEPHRKVRPNEPCYVPCVASFLANLRGMDLDEFVAAMDRNAERFFGLD